LNESQEINKTLNKITQAAITKKNSNHSDKEVFENWVKTIQAIKEIASIAKEKKLEPFDFISKGKQFLANWQLKVEIPNNKVEQEPIGEFEKLAN